MPKGFFVTGTDTGVGKTVASALLCSALEAIYWKPIQTGSREGTDRKTVMQLANLDVARTWPETYCFAPPVSPHLAARRARVRIDFAKIRAPQLPAEERLIAEGAGGVLVPINQTQLMVHLMQHLQLPVILVARTALGTINHTLLSLSALRAARLEVRGVILAGKPDHQNRQAIEHYGEVRVLGTIPILRSINRAILRKTFQKHFDRSAFAR
jgi:dethiobiotin synthase